MSKYNKLAEKYYHWLWADNSIREDRPNYLINLEIGVSIKFDYELAMFADFEEFVESIADVQFFYGNRPNKNKVDEILTDAWNYLAIEERILEEDLEDFEDEF